MFSNYLQILYGLIPVYLFILGGFIFRKIGWMNQKSDDSLLKLVINVFYPCLIFGYIFQNEALRDPTLIVIPPIVGFCTIIIGFAISYLVGKLIRLNDGKGLRTYAFSTGIYNYGFIAIPLINAVYQSKSATGTLMVYNTGIELAIWTVGILILSGNFGSNLWKKILNPPVLALIISLTINFIVPSDQGNINEGASGALLKTVHMLGNCSIPMALILIGASIRDLLGDRMLKPNWKIILSGTAVRLILLPTLFILGASILPFPAELKIVILVQSAMPCGMFPILMSKHYGGKPQIAVQLVLVTTALSMLTIPLWVSIGQHILENW